MSATIGLVANVYSEVNALPGWLECHLPWFDDVRVLHAGPQGDYSTDGTIELLERWRVPVEYCNIDDGFGKVRTQAVRMSPCDYVMILDADERFHGVHRVLSCRGRGTPHSEVDKILQGYDLRADGAVPDWEEIERLGAGLQVDASVAYNQFELLRQVLALEPDAVITTRRHWHDFSFRHPTQNWKVDPDWQVRILRNHPDIGYEVTTRMHEQLRGAEKICLPSMTEVGTDLYFDHYHFPFKRMEIAQRRHDVAVYDALSSGRKPPTWQEFSS